MRLMLSRVIQGETPLPPRGSKIESARKRGSGGGVGEEWREDWTK